VAGSLAFAFRPAEKGTSVELSYVVGGYNAKGFQEIAAGVDAVLRAQLERYRRSMETKKP
jgi:hypothetical protein